MKVLVIGNTGFVGKNIYQYLESTKKYDLKGISTNKIDLSKVNSNEALLKELSSESIVIMCAGVKKQLGDNLDTFKTNITILNNFCKAISGITVKKIIYFSSASVYGEDVAYDDKISEETPVQPRTYYGIAKYTAERLLEKISNDRQSSVVILRPPLIYGKDDLSRGYGPAGFTYKALNNEEITLWGDGSELREFIFVDDVSRTISRLINNDYNGILNVVSGTSYTYKGVLDSLKEIIRSDLKVKSGERTKEKVDHHYSNELFYQVVGNFEFTSLKDGLKNMCRSIVI